MEIVLTPKITLFGVDPYEVAKLYNMGGFVDIRIPKISGKIEAVRVFDRRHSGNPMEDIFSYGVRSSNEITIATNNCNQFNAPKNVKKIRCYWCRRRPKGEGRGMVIRSSSRHICLGTTELECYTWGTYCCPGCELAFIMEKIRVTVHSDPRLGNAEYLCKNLYKRSYPDEPDLKPSNHWSLLICNGGSLTSDEWESGSCQYKKLPGVVFYPVKEGYLRVKI